MVSIIRSFCGEKISQDRLKHRILGNYTTHRNHDSRKLWFIIYGLIIYYILFIYLLLLFIIIIYYIWTYGFVCSIFSV